MQRRTLAPPAASRVYELTPRGRELEPVVLALGRWGSTAPFPEAEAALGADATALALKTLFDGAAAGDLDAGYELRLGADSFRIRVADGEMELARGSADAPDATVATDPGTLAEVLWHGRPQSEAEQAQQLKISGSRAAARRLLTLFPLPGILTPDSMQDRLHRLAPGE